MSAPPPEDPPAVHRHRAHEPSLLVIFGGTGDLARRKLLPALGRLVAEEQLHPATRVVGVATNKANSEQSYRDLAREALSAAGLGADQCRALCTDRLHYQGIGEGREEDYRDLRLRLEALEREHGLPPRRTFYLALPTAALGATVDGLTAAGLNADAPGGWTRLVIEKPFGHDLESARRLVALLHGSFAEHQIFRIDHYLGKESVQNLLAFRFGNSIFESLWNRDRISAVEINVSEDLGLGTRAKYYDKAGALRDMIQSHLAQVLSLVAMEVPTVLSATSVRYEKTKVLQAIAPIGPQDVVFGRYAGGMVGGEQVLGYLQEDGVAQDSNTETFVALKLEIMNWRWQGVPFYLRTGKRLARRTTRVGVRFKSSPVCMFELDGVCKISSNVLVLQLQPNEGFSLYIDVKRPGSSTDLQRIPLSFRYGDHFDELPDAYQTLLLDVLRGDQTLFVHSDEVLESWRLFDPLLREPHAVYGYPAGSHGPVEAERLSIPDRALMRNP
jgi:glucose-6-phosphate 1-dehydrogenase